VRILFASQPHRSHLHSLLPMLVAAREQGHAVALASGAGLAPVAQGLGLELLPCGHDGDIADLDGQLPPELRGQLADAPIVVRHLMAFSAGLAPAFARDLLDRGAAWRPDVIVREPVEFGSVIAAERWGIPYASVMWAVYIDPRFIIRDAVAGVSSAFGLDGEAVIDGFDRHLVVRYLPPSWRVPETSWPPTAVSFRAPPYDRIDDRAMPDGMARRSGRPIVYATIGLSFSTDPAVFRALLDALDGLDLDAIVTFGHALDAAALEPVPANVRVAPYIPGSQVLPHCRAVVMHGGFNTLHQVLWHGLPSVVVPQMGGDQGLSAEHVARLGLGLDVPGPVPSVPGLRAAIERVIAEPDFASRSEAMRDEIQALPPVEEAIARLAAIAGATPAA
jgi:UDP:flavonoid glycosyltransferase YjiC (YdhE family)